MWKLFLYLNSCMKSHMNWNTFGPNRGQPKQSTAILKINIIFLQGCNTNIDRVSSHFWNPNFLTLSPTWANPPTVAKFVLSPPWDASPWLLKRSELSSCWQMHRQQICNKYFITRLTILSWYHKRLINNNSVNKKMHLLIQLQNSNWYKKKNK